MSKKGRIPQKTIEELEKELSDLSVRRDCLEMRRRIDYIENKLVDKEVKMIEASEEEITLGKKIRSLRSHIYGRKHSTT